MDPNIERAAYAIQRASALVFTAGAGMGVDSGLPDFRGKNGFWNTYPAFEHLGLCFEDIANPEWFEKEPELAWGFYGHRMNMYRTTKPHDGYHILNKWGKSSNHFIYTSNVDGAYQKAGFREDQIWEAHGSIHHLQPLIADHRLTWEEAENVIIPAEGFEVDIDPKTCKAKGELPSIDGSLLRPNVLMFCDIGWFPVREEMQHRQFVRWRDASDFSSLVVIECGAGVHIPTVRFFGENLANEYNGTLIRINIDERQADIQSYLWENLNEDKMIPIAMGAKDALTQIDRLV
jgi:NAD-dependent SIR2 family protein deacetylase